MSEISLTVKYKVQGTETNIILSGPVCLITIITEWKHAPKGSFPPLFDWHYITRLDDLLQSLFGCIIVGVIFVGVEPINKEKKVSNDLF